VILTDNPIPGDGSDEFGFLDHAKVLCRAIGQTTDLPLTVGIFGPWGSGKSSFLNICRDLLREQGFVALGFNPWKYDRRDEIWHALIQTLLDELVQLAEEPSGQSAGGRVKAAVQRAWELRAVAAWLAAGVLAPVITHGVISADLLGQARAAAEEQRLSQEAIAAAGYRHVNVFEKDFADTVKALTDERPVVLLVDDLDRCRGESALMALEALRLFTGDAPCVFMVAMDYQALTEAASAHFGGDALRGRNYLEKLVNFSYYLPAPRFESISRSFRKKLDYLADDPAMWDLIRNHMGGNPRRIRRFVNAFNLAMATLALAQGSDPSRDRQVQVAVLLVLRQEHPAFFDFLDRDARSWQRFQGTADAWSKVAGLSGQPDQMNAPDFPPELRKLVEADPGLPQALASIMPDHGEEHSAFPAPPTRNQIAFLTEAMVLVPVLQGSPGPGTPP
jgi:nucleoside-triphosphatase THEP1